MLRYKKKYSHIICGGPIWLGQEGGATDITKKCNTVLACILGNGKNGGSEREKEE